MRTYPRWDLDLRYDVNLTWPEVKGIANEESLRAGPPKIAGALAPIKAFV